jgi:ubiquinone/menaquinone biosynthesis C-methylase UbiE
MTPEMLKRARENAMKGGFRNVEFRKGNIENLPLEGRSVDVVISNCVINLSPEKDKVFSEAFRVLRQGGRMMVSDIVLEKALPTALKSSITGHIACLSGADLRTMYLDRIGSAGFRNIEVQGESLFSLENLGDEATIAALMSESGLTREELSGILKGVKSIKVKAEKRI